MSAPEPAGRLPEPRGPRTSSARDYSLLVFVMGAMIALGVGMAESSLFAGLLTLAAWVPVAVVVNLICSRVFRGNR